MELFGNFVLVALGLGAVGFLWVTVVAFVLSVWRNYRS